MFKLLIVEDERWEREGLVEFVDWAAMGIGVVETACDGIEGLEKATGLQPDIVVTDIQMPGRNGIEMARLIKERQPDTSVVVLTGYDDFQFARDALRFRAVDYLLKPIEEEELLATMERVIRHCEETRLRRLQEESHALAYETGRRAALQRTFAGLLAGRDDGGEAEAEIGAALADRSGRGVDAYAVWVLRPPAGDGLTNPAALEDAAEETLGRPVLLHEAGEAGAAEFALLFGLAEAERERQHELAGLLLRRLAAMRPDGDGDAGEGDAGEGDGAWALGRGPAADSLSGASAAYGQAGQALKHALWTGAATAGFGDEEEAKRRFAAAADAFARECREHGKRVRNKLGAGGEAETKAAASELFACIAAHPGAGRAYVGSLLGGLLSDLWTLAMPTGQGAAAESAVDLARLHGCERQADAKRCVLEAVGRISALLHEKRDNKDDYIVARVQRLIEERYGLTELSLAYLAGEVFISPNHLGMMFKKKTGKTPLAYIQEYRLARAEELLRTTKRRVSAIAEEIGIPNTSYFGTLFKQVYGMTPGEYQETAQR